MNLEFAAIHYRAIRDRLRAEDPQIDEQTLADTVEGLTDLHEILAAVIRAALADEALATGLKGRIAEMEDRLGRLRDRAAKRRQIAKDAMVELDLKKLAAPDFTASVRPGMPALMVIDEAAVPSIYWEPRDPRLNRQGLLADLKQGAEITGVYPRQPRAGLEREDQVMGFSAKQVQALRRQPGRSHIRTREAHGRELTYLEGWYAISEANRIFGFDGWSRETLESRCVLARENRGSFLAVYLARVRVTVHADGATIIREGHGTGEGRGTSPGEVHDIALKAAETDATKRALATFGKTFRPRALPGRQGSGSSEAPALTARPSTRGWPRWFPSRRYDPNSTAVPLLRPAAKPAGRALSRRAAEGGTESGATTGTGGVRPTSGSDRQEPARHPRAETVARQSTSEVRCLATLLGLRPTALGSTSPAFFAATRHRHEGQRRIHGAALPRPSPATASGRQ